MANYIAYKSKPSRERVLACYDNILANWPVKVESRFLETSFGTTHVVISGRKNAKPLVLLHGAGGNAGMWVHNIAELAKRFRIYAIDIIGEPGKSAGIRPQYASDGHALWLKEIHDLLGLKDVALGGISLGGWLACQFALKFPNLINNLILISPPAILHTNVHFLLRTMWAALMPTSLIVIGFIKYMSYKAKTLPDTALQNFVTTWQAYNPNINMIPSLSREHICNLPPNTLMILGEDEVMYCSNAAATHISAVAENIKVVIIPKAGHIVSYDQPDLLNAEIIKFVNPA